MDARRLWVTQEGLREGEPGGPLQPLPAQDYLLFQIECLQERDDYRSFPYIRQPFEDALDAKADGDDPKGQTLLNQAKRAVQRSPDSTGLDRKRIRKALDDAYANDGFVGGGEEGLRPSRRKRRWNGSTEVASKMRSEVCRSTKRAISPDAEPEE